MDKYESKWIGAEKYLFSELAEQITTNGIAANQKQSFWVKSLSLDGVNDKLDYGLLFRKVILQDWKRSNYSFTTIKKEQMQGEYSYKSRVSIIVST